jgi:hypothetical protein
VQLVPAVLQAERGGNVRQRVGDRMVLTTYGRSSGFGVDPIEKKPLNHFFTLLVLQAPVP